MIKKAQYKLNIRLTQKKHYEEFKYNFIFYLHNPFDFNFIEQKQNDTPSSFIWDMCYSTIFKNKKKKRVKFH